MSSPRTHLTRVNRLTRQEWSIASKMYGNVGTVFARTCMSGVTVVSLVYYEIRVSGTVPAEAMLDFERMSVSVEPVETVLHGPMSDQGALHGLLARLELFGVEVVEVRRLRGQDSSGGGAAR